NPARGTAISYSLKSPVAGAVTVSILDAAGRTLCSSSAPSSAGIHRVQWTLVAPMTAAPAPNVRGGGGAAPGGGARDTSCGGGSGRGGAAAAVTPGTYTAKLTVGGRAF